MSSVLPKVFIGSSVEGIKLARSLEVQLQYEAEVTIWKDGIFGLGEIAMESIETVLNDFDFAILILSPDDIVTSRDQTIAAPRDNLILEYGLFAGRIGHERVYFVVPEQPPLKLPSDLFGLKPAKYNQNRRDQNWAAALSPVATDILKKIEMLGLRREPSVAGVEVGIRSYYFRNKRTSFHLPLADATKRIYLLGATLVKYAVEIQEMNPLENVDFHVILPDPHESILLDKWIEASPTSITEYVKDILFTLRILRSRYQELNLQLRLSSQMLLSTITLLDDKKLTVEHRFYGFEVKDRLLVDIDPLSMVGQLYLKGFDLLFDSSYAVDNKAAYDMIINKWEDILRCVR